MAHPFRGKAGAFGALARLLVPLLLRACEARLFRNGLRQPLVEGVLEGKEGIPL